jgi:hypothetical protein
MMDVERCKMLSEYLNELREEAYLFVYSSPWGTHAHKRCGAPYSITTVVRCSHDLANLEKSKSLGTMQNTSDVLIQNTLSEMFLITCCALFPVSFLFSYHDLVETLRSVS